MSIKRNSSPVVNELLKLTDLLRYFARQQAADHHLSILQIRILQHLLYHPKQVHHAAAFGRQLLITHATLSSALNTLQQKKMIHAIKDPHDKRKKALELTDWGVKVATITSLYAKPVQDIIEHMPPDKKDVLVQTLHAISSKLERTLQTDDVPMD